MSEYHYYPTPEYITKEDCKEICRPMARILAAILMREHGYCLDAEQLKKVPDDVGIKMQRYADGSVYVFAETTP